MRQLLILLAAVGAACLCLGTPASAGTWPSGCGHERVHNFRFGLLHMGDRLLNSTGIHRPSSFLRVLSFDENIQTKGVISFFEVLDRKRDGSSGCVYLNGGGVGFFNVVLHVKSERNHGVNFQVNLYGR